MFSIDKAEAAVRKTLFNSPQWTLWDDDFKREAAKNDIRWEWLKAIALNESSLGRERSVAHGIKAPFDVEGSKSFDGLSWGLMQVTLKTGRQYDAAISPEKLNDPAYSIRLGAQILGDEWKRFPGDLEFAVKAYNQGARNSRRERDGLSKGFTGDYWPRFKRNLERVEAMKS